MTTKNRHYCTSCKKKRNEDKMVQIYYPLIRNRFWHCKECMSTAVDISYSMYKTKIIEVKTIHPKGFELMSGMYQEIETVVAAYGNYFTTHYRFL